MFKFANQQIGQEDVGLLSLAYFGAGVSQIWQVNQLEYIHLLVHI